MRKYVEEESGRSILLIGAAPSLDSAGALFATHVKVSFRVLRTVFVVVRVSVSVR